MKKNRKRKTNSTKQLFGFIETNKGLLPTYFLSVLKIPEEILEREIFFYFEEKANRRYFFISSEIFLRPHNNWLYKKSRHEMGTREHQRLSKVFNKSSFWILALVPKKDAIKYIVIESETGKIKDSFKSLPQKKE